MDEKNVTASSTRMCFLKDELGYDLIPMYRILFSISCVTVPIGILLSIVFVVTMGFRIKKVLNVNNHALFLSCVAQVVLALLQGPIRVYFYYHNGCLPAPGSLLCELTVYLDYIPTQIHNFLIAQLSIERLFLVTKPFVFRRARQQSYSLPLYIHYVSLFVSFAFPCLYYPIIMRNGAATIDLDDPSQTQTCDLWYASGAYETFDLLITFVPYFLILISCAAVIGVALYRKYIMGGGQRRRVGSRRQRRLLFSLELFLGWFLVTWSPWVLYDFFQTVLNLTYSVYIDAITTFMIYLNYTFSSAIILLTFKDMRRFCLDKCCFLWATYILKNRVIPVRVIGPVPTDGSMATRGPVCAIRYTTTGHRIAGVQ